MKLRKKKLQRSLKSLNEELGKKLTMKLWRVESGRKEREENPTEDETKTQEKGPNLEPMVVRRQVIDLPSSMTRPWPPPAWEPSSNLLVRRVILTRKRNRTVARVWFISNVKTTTLRTRAETMRRMIGSVVEDVGLIEVIQVRLRHFPRRKDTNLLLILNTLMIVEDPCLPRKPSATSVTSFTGREVES